MNGTLLRLAARSLWYRRSTLALTTLILSLSVALLLGVQYLRTEVKQSFLGTITDTDLIVGARSGPSDLLLYSAFHLGGAPNSVQWSTFEAIRDNEAVKWAVPLSLGDSYQDYQVVGTTNAFFEHYRYRNGASLDWSEGGPFGDIFEAVLGAEVAAQEKLGTGDKIMLSHHMGSTRSVEHDAFPFKVSGILKRTGTPTDRSVIVSLAAIEALHIGWVPGLPRPDPALTPDEARRIDLTPKTLTAAFVGVYRPDQVFRLQGQLNNFEGEPLTAILPALALKEFWSGLRPFEIALLVITSYVAGTGAISLVSVLGTTRIQRNRENAIYRASGAGPVHISCLFALEGMLVALVACFFGLLWWYLSLGLLGPWLESQLELIIQWRWPSPLEWQMLACIPGLALLVSLVTATRTYRQVLGTGFHIAE